MKKRAFLIPLFAVFAFAVSGVNAESLTPLPSVPDYTGGDGWGFALGAGAELETAYDGSDEYEIEFSPSGALQWRDGNDMLFWENNETGWRGVRGNWLLQFGGRYEFGREADDSEDGHLDGLEEVEGELIAFGEARWTPDGEWRNWLGGRIFGGELGVLALAAAGRRFGEHLEAFGYATFASAKFNNRDFGVSESESNSSALPMFAADSGFRSVGITAIYRRMISEHIEITAASGFELYSDSIGKSPLSRKNYEPEISLSAVYVF